MAAEIVFHADVWRLPFIIPKDASNKDCIQSQSSCLVVEEWLHYVVLLNDKLFSASMTIFSELLSIFVDSRVTNFILLYAMHSGLIWYFTTLTPTFS